MERHEMGFPFIDGAERKGQKLSGFHWVVSRNFDSDLYYYWQADPAYFGRPQRSVATATFGQFWEHLPWCDHHQQLPPLHRISQCWAWVGWKTWDYDCCQSDPNAGLEHPLFVEDFLEGDLFNKLHSRLGSMDISLLFTTFEHNQAAIVFCIVLSRHKRACSACHCN